MGRPICVFCSSSNQVPSAYTEVAGELGAAIASAGHSLIYGGMDAGLMGSVARAVHAGGSKVTGVLPQFMADQGDTYDKADEIIVATDMHQRKAVMYQMAEAFVVLPGGFGTLEEMGEILTFSNLELHEKPIVIINTNGFYDSLLNMFERFISEGFAKDRHRRSYHVADDTCDAMTYLETRFAGCP